MLYFQQYNNAQAHNLSERTQSLNQGVEKLGDLIGRQVPEHPDRAAKMLELAYKAVGFQASKFPSKKRNSSREFLQGYLARQMADMLKDPSHSAVVNIFMPPEIFHALDIPITAPEAMATYVVCTAAEQPFIEKAQEEGASDTYCSLHSCLLGIAESHVLKKPALVANTTLACDANQLTFRTLAQLWQVPHCVIDVPSQTDEDAVSYVAGQLRGLTHIAEEAVGRHLEEDALKECIVRGNQTLLNYRKYLSHRMEAHFPEAMTPELMLDFNNHLLLGSETALKFSELLLHDLKTAPRHTTEKRILWMHVLPNWQNSVMDIFQGADNHRIEIVGSDIAYSSIDEMDPEKPYESMARRLVFDSFNGPGNRRIQRTLKMAQKLGVDGILIFCQWGCKQTQGISMAAKQVFEEHGFPTLILDGDACNRTNGGSEQIVTRANAFVEQLEAHGGSAL